MITKIQLAAMSRADIPEEERKDFFLYVDEFQNFATESFAEILSEARKYHLGLVVAHQYIAQLTTPESTKVRDAVFGNVGTMICFRVGAADAFFLLKEFEPYFVEEDLVNLDKYNIYLKLLINGVSSRPFSATTIPPLTEEKVNLKNMEKAIKVSRERYSHPKAEVEERIVKWLSLEKTMEEQGKLERMTGAETQYKKGTGTDNTGAPKSEQDQLEAVCDHCFKKTYLSFKPRADLNVFCKDCLKLFKNGQIDVNKLKFNNLDISKKPDKVEIKEEDKTKVKSETNKEKEIIEEKVEKKKEEISLKDLSKTEPQSFKSSGGRNVKQGESIKL